MPDFPPKMKEIIVYLAALFVILAAILLILKILGII